MASKTKIRSGGKSPTQSSLSTGGQSHARKSAKFKEHRSATEDEKISLAFKVLSAENTKKLAGIEDVVDLQEALAEVLQISNHPIDLKDGATLDYYVAAFWWGKEQNYNNDQLSALYTVIHTLFENIKEKQMSLPENLKEFRKMLAGIGQESTPEIKLPSGGLEAVFDITQAKAITDYVYTSLFQHYRLFEFMLGHTQAEDIIGTDLTIELPPAASVPWPPPLDEAVSEETFQRYIATPPPSETEEQADGDLGDEAAVSAEATEAELKAEADVLAQLTPEEIQKIMDSVFTEMLGGLETDVAAKLRDKENAFINRINKLHNVSEN